MSERPFGVPPAIPAEPLPSALGIVVRRGEDGAGEVFVVERAARARFMPGHIAFPGGRMESEDGTGDDRFARCVAREVLEETGIEIPSREWLDAGERTTPPIFAVRFHTRFFVAALPEGARVPDATPQPAEVASQGFISARVLLADWERGRALVPPPLLPLLRLVAREPRLDPARLAARIREANAMEQALPRIEFVPGIWMLPVATATLPPATHTNVWLHGGRKLVVVDPGSDDPAEIDSLVRLVRKREAEGAVAHAILLTHHHRDHVGGAAELSRALRIPVLAHDATLERAAGALRDVRVEALKPQVTLDLDGARLDAIHTPGHAPGHLVFHDPARRALIAGDLVSGLSTILIGLAEGDMDLYLASLAKARDLGAKTVLPAHGPPLPARVLDAAIAHRLRREAAILAALDGGGALGLAALAEAAYADTPDAPPVLRELQTRAHLERLEKAGRIRSSGSGTGWERIGG